MKKSFQESEKTICIADAEALIKRYKVRATGNAGSMIEASVPKEALTRNPASTVNSKGCIEESCGSLEIRVFSLAIISFEKKGEFNA